eukprot:Phypoly_transcript_10496.p1 GENE.Phypoly_transcript_10496~~Phypoly_transcript_10496.p1  ORF type:complete len:339 (+),score=53.61 Phypoly_transcript_10496:50-1066(+)
MDQEQVLSSSLSFVSTAFALACNPSNLPSASPPVKHRERDPLPPLLMEASCNDPTASISPRRYRNTAPIPSSLSPPTPDQDPMLTCNASNPPTSPRIRHRNHRATSLLRTRASNLGVKILAPFYFLISLFLSLSLLSARVESPSAKPKHCTRQPNCKRKYNFQRKRNVKRNPSLQVFYIMDGDKSDDTAPRRLTAPSPPRDLEMQVKSHSVLLSWKRPIDDGGYDEIKYMVEQKDESKLHSDWVPLYEVCGEELEIIRPPDKFWYRVAAKNTSGTSPFCDICGVMEHKNRIFIEEPDIEDAEITTTETLNSENLPVSESEDEENEEEEEDLDDLYSRL